MTKFLTLTLIFLTTLGCACGRDEMFDKQKFEQFIDNSYDNDVQPLSSYHGEWKDQILLAKSTVESMGMKLPQFMCEKDLEMMMREVGVHSHQARKPLQDNFAYGHHWDLYQY